MRWKEGGGRRPLYLRGLRSALITAYHEKGVSGQVRDDICEHQIDAGAGSGVILWDHWPMTTALWHRLGVAAAV